MMTAKNHTVSQLHYRSFEEKDVPGVMRLWAESSGWGGITEEQFRRWYLQSPYGPCLVTVCTDEEENILGQVVFMPSLVAVDGRIVKALRISSPILHQAASGGSIASTNHPVVCMLREGFAAAGRGGYELLYMFPSKGWTALLRRFPKLGLPPAHIALYDCFCLPQMKVDATNRHRGSLQLSAATEFSAEYDTLWEAAKKNLAIGCGIVRGAAWMQWKYGKYLVVEARDEDTGQLKGYCALHQRTGLLADALALSDAAMQEMLSGLSAFLAAPATGGPAVSFATVKGMLTHQYQGWLKNAAWVPENFVFAFSCLSISSRLPYEAIHPQRWYAMPND